MSTEEMDNTVLSLLESADRHVTFQTDLAKSLSAGFFQLNQARKGTSSFASIDDIRFDIDPIRTDSTRERRAEELVEKLVSLDLDVVAFDMDQCAVAVHSNGSLRNEEHDIRAYVEKATPDFILVSKLLHQKGIKLAIATHSDAAEHGPTRPLGEYILGDALVQRVLEHAVPSIAASFKVVAYNPNARDNEDPNDAAKKFHIREIAEHYSVPPSRVLLFDDDINNVSDTADAFMSIQVSEKCGFQISTALQSVHCMMAAGAEEEYASTPTPTNKGKSHKLSVSLVDLEGTNPILLCSALPSPALRKAQVHFSHTLDVIIESMAEDVRSMQRALLACSLGKDQ